MNLSNLTEDRKLRRAVVKTIMNLRGPQNPGRFLSSCTTGGLSRRVQLHGVS
jgi:hypothetical protein